MSTSFASNTTASNTTASNTTASNTFKPTMSLYIPRVYANITESFIINVFEDKIRFGKVSGVHMEKIHRTKNNYSVVIHFESWNETIVTTNFQTRIFKQGFARVVHDDPWFWTIFKNNQKKLSKKDKRRLSDAQNMYITQIKKKKKLYEKT